MGFIETQVETDSQVRKCLLIESPVNRVLLIV